MKRLWLLLVLLLCAHIALAQQHPNDTRGFEPGKVYNFNDIDTVSSYNGNLMVHLPVGPSYTVNGQLSYRLGLFYNSHIWKYEQEADGTNKAIPIRSFNAGLGWTLTLGRLFENGDPENLGTEGWTYQSSDGADHQFRSNLHGGSSNDGLFTRDGTYMRLSFVGQTRVVELADGTKNEFTRITRLTDPAEGQWPGAATGSNWLLTGIIDQFGNRVTISYSNSVDQGFPEIWKIDDGARTTWVYFESSASPTDVVLSFIDTPKVGGGSARYTFAMDTLDVPLPLSDSTNRTMKIPVTVLISVEPPAGNPYLMTTTGHKDFGHAAYDVSEIAPQPITGIRGNTPGVLTRLFLPTLGSIGWTHDRVQFTLGSRNPKLSPAIEFPTAVTSRKTYLPTDLVNPLATWTYGRRFSLPTTCTAVCHHDDGTPFDCSSGRSRQLTTWVTEPGEPGRTTISYFSNYEAVDSPTGDLCTTAPEGWVSGERGLPFTRFAKLDNRYLSSEVRTGDIFSGDVWLDGKGMVPDNGGRVRATYVTYRLDSDSQSELAFDYNAIPSSSATYFYDDKHDCGDGHAACYFTAVDSLDFDNYGHFRQASTDGNFPGGGNFRTTFTNYNPTPPASSWLLNLPTERCSADETSRRTTLISCNTLPGALITKTQYDEFGFLKARRTLKNSGGLLDTSDLLATFAHDGHGNVTSEQFYGGDTQAIGVSDPFAPPSSPKYAISHALTYTGNALTRDIATYANGATASDVKYDQFTGLATATRDVSDLETLYNYDALGRIISVAPPGVTPTTYTYTDALLSNSVFTPAKVVALSDASASGIGKVSKEYKFDSFGRLWREKSLLPDNTWNITQTDFDVLGRKIAVSAPERLTVDEAFFTPAHKTTYSSFDPFGRAHVIKAPDLSTTTFDFSGVRKVTRTVSIETSAGPTPVDTSEEYDALNRLVTLTEPNGTITTYAYDSADHLTSVSMPGDNGIVQHRFFDYDGDGRGFLHSEQHPELGINGNGTTTYANYDARGHALNKLTGGKYDLSFTYDAAERLRTVNDSGGSHEVKVFTFADQNGTSTPIDYRKGKLVTATRYNPMPSPISADIDVTETYKYENPSGRASERDTEIKVKNTSNTLQSFKELFTYDTLGAITAPGYPTCLPPVTCSIPSLSTATNSHTNGALTSVTDFASLAYNGNGTLGSVSHANGVVDTIQPDDNGMPRPKSLDYAGWTAPTCSGPSTPTVTAGSTRLGTSNQGTTLTATATGCGTLSYQWYRGNTGDQTFPLGTSATYATGSLQSSTSFWVKVTDSVTTSSANSATSVITVCDLATITAQPQSSALDANNSGTTISVGVGGGCGTISYQWYRGNSGDTTTPLQGTAATYATGSLTSTTSFWVKVTDSTGPTTINSSTAVITVNTLCTPQVTEAPQDQTINAGANASLHVTVTGCTGRNFRWWQGPPGDRNASITLGTGTVGNGISTLQNYSPSQTVSVWVEIFGDSLNTVIRSATITVVSPVPTGLNAHVTPNQAAPFTSITVTWQPSGADHYLLQRCSSSGCSSFAAASPFVDVNRTPNTTYVYRVASVDSSGAGVSDWSIADLATTMAFTSLQAFVTTVQFAHLTELLNGLNAVLAASSPTQLTWQNIHDHYAPSHPTEAFPLPAANVPICAAHIKALRAEMLVARAAAGVPAWSFTDALTTAPPTPIKAIHFRELQDATQ